MDTPKYTDSEVLVFHPYLQSVLESIISEEYDDRYEVTHHEYIGDIETDLMVKEKESGRILLIIEVKRVPADVNSTRNQLQAQSYIRQANQGLFISQSPYYALTNIELTNLYKYSEERRSVEEQKIQEGPYETGNFSDDDEVFLENCIITFYEILDTVINDDGTFSEAASRLDTLLKGYNGDLNRWHNVFYTTGYEYIRGAISPPNWREAIRYKRTPGSISNLGSEIDFNEVFRDPIPDSEEDGIWDVDLLSQVHETGRKYKSGDDLSQLSFKIISEGRENQGLVPTDLELSRLLSIVLVKQYLSADSLNDEEKICDPAAGTGSLIAVLAKHIRNISPSQIWANEIESEMMEPLSLVLGLQFPSEISNKNHPLITNESVLNLSPEDFRDTKLLVLNPPFQSGNRSVALKRGFNARIRELTGSNARLNVGQIGLEALFLELIVKLLPDNAIMGIVFPKQFLTSTGNEASALRRFLVEEFNLSYLINYSRKGLFEDVAKATCLLIGQKNHPMENVTTINVSTSLSNLNLEDFINGLENNLDGNIDGNLSYGSSFRKIPSTEMIETADKSWGFISLVRWLTREWLDSNMSDNFGTLSDRFTTRRGRVGNIGASHLIFPDYNTELWNHLEELIPENWLRKGVRVVDSVNKGIITENEAPNRVLAIDVNSIEEEDLEYETLINILEIYNRVVANQESNQRRNTKSINDLLNILSREFRHQSEEFTVFIPRNIRRQARAFLAVDSIYVTTNMVEAYGQSEKAQYLLLSWCLSVFSQLQFEYMAKDQEGTRKLETGGQIYDLLIPDFDQIDEEFLEEVCQIINDDQFTFTDLYQLEASKLDRLWAEQLWGEEADEKLNNVLLLLSDLIYERDPQSSN